MLINEKNQFDSQLFERPLPKNFVAATFLIHSFLQPLIKKTVLLKLMYYFISAKQFLVLKLVLLKFHINHKYNGIFN